MPRRVPHAFMLAPPFSFLYVAIQQSGSSYPLSRLKHVCSGVVRMLSASFMTSSMFLLARCRMFVPAQLIWWSFACACSAIADLSMRLMTHASLCSFNLFSSLRLLSHMYMLHGTSYATFSCFSVGRGSFTLVRRLQRVGPDFNTALMLKSRHALLILSLTLAMYGRKATGGSSVSLSSVVASLSRCSSCCG